MCIFEQAGSNSPRCSYLTFYFCKVLCTAGVEAMLHFEKSVEVNLKISYTQAGAASDAGSCPFRYIQETVQSGSMHISIVKSFYSS